MWIYNFVLLTDVKDSLGNVAKAQNLDFGGHLDSAWTLGTKYLKW